MRRLVEKDYTIPKKILEINRRHPLIKNLSALIAAGQSEGVVNDCIQQLYDNGLLLEGLHPNPAEMVGRIQQLMEAATDVKRINGRARCVSLYPLIRIPSVGWSSSFSTW